MSIHLIVRILFRIALGYQTIKATAAEHSNEGEVAELMKSSNQPLLRIAKCQIRRSMEVEE